MNRNRAGPDIMDEMRLQKYIALCGVASRRKAEELISRGIVAVNGETISEQGFKIKPEDTVTINGKVITPEKNKVYILLNKPRGVVSTASDEEGRRTVLDCVEGINERLYPVGRLDYNTTGLLILSNDGDFTKFMTHPSHQVPKIYIATASGEFDSVTINRLRAGVDIGDYVTAPAKVAYGGTGYKRNTIRITIREGKNRQIRRMIEAVGLRVRALRRVGIGNINDSKLQPGEWRHLSKKEIRGLGYDID